MAMVAPLAAVPGPALAAGGRGLRQQVDPAARGAAPSGSASEARRLLGSSPSVAALCGAVALAAPRATAQCEGQRVLRRHRRATVASAAGREGATDEEQAESAASSTPPVIAVCGFGEQNGGTSRVILSTLASAGVETLWVDLAQPSKSALEGATVLVLCPDTAEDSSERLKDAVEGIGKLSEMLPDSCGQVIAILREYGETASEGFDFASIFGGGTTWGNVEREIDRMGQYRSPDLPFRTFCIRTGKIPSGSQSRIVVDLIPKVPEMLKTGSTCDTTSKEAVANAVLEALNIGADSSFFIQEEEASEELQERAWKDMLLPFVGPELLRLRFLKTERKQMMTFIRDWINGQRGVQNEELPDGFVMKFRPIGVPRKTTFDELDKGGIRFVIEAGASTEDGILRLVRCAVSKKGAYTNESGYVAKFRTQYYEATGQVDVDSSWSFYRG